MIITCRKQVPLGWITLAVLPWAAVVYKSQVMGAAFIFSLKKFVDNPAGLTLVLSLPGLMSLIVAPFSSYLSDRTWTRFGRRKPFILTSWCGTVVCMSLMPLAPSFWWLLVCYLCFGLFNDIGSSPTEVMNQEIVPPHQRGRATAGMQWSSNFATLIFYFVALGRFDDVQFVGSVPVTGEQAIYWSSALLLGVMAMFVMLGIRETRTNPSKVAGRMSPKSVFTAIFDRTLWPIYTLIFASAMLNSGLGAMGNLLYIEQWHYSKQEMGINVAVGTTLNLVLILFIGVVADRFNRMRAYQALIIAAITLKAAYFCYVKFLLPDQRPTLVEIIVFGEMLSICSILTSVVFTPMVYDYVTRDKMGTYAAGATMVMRLTQLVTLNGVGLFVWAYAAIFQPPAGQMTRIVLREVMTSDEVRAIIAKLTWRNSDGADISPLKINANAWYATGLVNDSGRCWEIRVGDPKAEKLVEHKEELKKSVAQSDGTGHGEQITAELDRRSELFQRQVVRAFGAQLMKNGSQIEAAIVRQAVVIELRSPTRIGPETLQAVRNQMRQRAASVIDVRSSRQGQDYTIKIGAVVEDSSDRKNVIASLMDGCRQSLEQNGATETASIVALSRVTPAQAIELKLAVVEDPAKQTVSPIMVVANALTRKIFRGAESDNRLEAVANVLRAAEVNNLINLSSGGGANHHITVLGIFTAGPATAAKDDDEVDQRLKDLLRSHVGPFDIQQVRQAYRAVAKAAASQRITVAQPVLAAEFAPLRYDYMCGYLWMFLLGLIGLFITFAFARRERRGLMRKWGVEEVSRQ